VVTSDAAAHLGLGVSRLLGGSVFSLGLMLVVVCGAELFTGNVLLAKAALHQRLPSDLARPQAMRPAAAEPAAPRSNQ